MALPDHTGQGGAPGRPRSFDETQALERAMHVFWAKGYQHTSYPELEAATGLHRQSLRYAFGDKAGLFRRAVEHYARGRLDTVGALLHRPGPAAANIRAVFDFWAGDARATGRGCLMVNSLAEFADALGAVAPVLAATNRGLLSAFTDAFRAAQAEGAVRADIDPDILAAQGLALGDGLMLHARNGGLHADPAALLEAFLSMARAPPGQRRQGNVRLR
jgi:TetR/AcrR family transcriptional repressor of nem operon